PTLPHPKYWLRLSPIHWGESLGWVTKVGCRSPSWKDPIWMRLMVYSFGEGSFMDASG
ncbi:hypothetical protein LINPERHAP2_LOCUS19328, partial [Linum perenne]